MRKYKVLKRFLVWRLRHVNDRQFMLIMSAVVGILVGLLFALVLGISGAGGADFAVAVPSGGFALVKARDSGAFIITRDGQATVVKKPSTIASQLKLD